VTKIISSVLERNSLPGAIASLVTGGKDVGEALVESRDVELGLILLLALLFVRANRELPSILHW
jgi:hypothetical protein